MKTFEYKGRPAIFIYDLMETIVRFKECGIHTMIRYAGEVCPVCESEERRTKLLGKIYVLENEVASLEISRATAAAD